MDAEPKKRFHTITVTVILLLFLLPVVYVLSSAPAVRLGLWPSAEVTTGNVVARRLKPGILRELRARKVGTSMIVVVHGHSGSIAAYKPVEWLIDETPLREPLFWWADVWGVGDDVRRLARLRSQ